MIHIVLALIVFLIVVVIHLLLSRQSKTKDASTGVFIFTASLGVIVLWLLFDVVTFIHSKYFLKSTATIMYLLLMPLYITFYRSVNEMSPSLKITQVLQQKSSASYEDLWSAINEEDFVQRGLEALVKSGQVRKKDGKFLLSGKGKFLALFARLDRVFFKRSMGGQV
jgi:hypothetical protein